MTTAHLWDIEVYKIYRDLEEQHLKELGMIDVDSAYAHYMAAAYQHLEDVGIPPRWKVRVCLPGEDDKVVPYYANESSFMCDLLVTQTQLGHETYVEWLEP